MRAEPNALAGAGASSLMQTSFAIELKLSVNDPASLWSAAVEKGLRAEGATIEDLCDVLGPREDPDLSACVAMLTAPIAIAGCRLQDFEVIRQKGGAPVGPAANDLSSSHAMMDALA